MDPVTKWFWRRNLEKSPVIERNGEYLCYPPWMFGSFLKASRQQKALLEEHLFKFSQLFTWSILFFIIIIFIPVLLIFSEVKLQLIVIFMSLFVIIGSLFVYNGKAINRIMLGAEKSSTKINIEYIAEQSSGKCSWFKIIFVLFFLLLMTILGPYLNIITNEYLSTLRVLGLVFSEVVFIAMMYLWVKILFRKLKDRKILPSS